MRLVDATPRQRGFGDYFGYTFVLRGQAELMVECDLKPWDLAPFAVLLPEAGGRSPISRGARASTPAPRWRPTAASTPRRWRS